MKKERKVLLFGDGRNRINNEINIFPSTIDWMFDDGQMLVGGCGALGYIDATPCAVYVLFGLIVAKSANPFRQEYAFKRAAERATEFAKQNDIFAECTIKSQKTKDGIIKKLEIEFYKEV